jgi:hypothetical protein
LGELRPGAVPLQVPLEGDIFQLAMLRREGTDMGYLVVGVAEDAIVISREDNQALQVDDNDEPAGPPEKRKRSQLFAGPISELVLSRTIPSSSVYRVHGEGLDIPDMRRFDKFMTQIFWSAYSIQNQGAKVADIMTILDRDEGKSGKLIAILESHAADSLAKNTSNAKYAETVRLRAQQAEVLITNKSGEVISMAASWLEDMQPIVETVFATDLNGHPIGEYQAYMPTVFAGVFGRTRIVSTDEMFGPVIALDLASEHYLTKRADVQQ